MRLKHGRWSHRVCGLFEQIGTEKRMCVRETEENDTGTKREENTEACQECKTVKRRVYMLNTSGNSEVIHLSLLPPFPLSPPQS